MLKVTQKTENKAVVQSHHWCTLVSDQVTGNPRMCNYTCWTSNNKKIIYNITHDELPSYIPREIYHCKMHVRSPHKTPATTILMTKSRQTNEASPCIRQNPFWHWETNLKKAKLLKHNNRRMHQTPSLILNDVLPQRSNTEDDACWAINPLLFYILNANTDRFIGFKPCYPITE